MIIDLHGQDHHQRGPGLYPATILNELSIAAASIRANPKFADALHLFAAGYADALGDDPASKIVMEEARLLLFGQVITMHHHRSSSGLEKGITLSRLQEFGRKNHIASKNRIAALLSLLKHARYLQVARCGGADGRVVTFEPTERARDTVLRFVLPFLKTLDFLSSDEALQGNLRRDSVFQEAIVAHMMELYVNGCAIFDAIPQMRLFSERDAGYEILLRLWSMLEPTTPKAGQVVSLPYDKLSKQFGVSRTHVRRLIESAARQGYLGLLTEGGRAIQIRPSLVELVETFVSLHLALYLCASKRALVEAGRPGRDRSRIASAVVSRIPKPGLVFARHPKDYVFCLSVPFTNQDSFRHIIAGYQDAVSMLGGRLTVAEANWDARTQSEQIASFVGSKPNALFVVPTDPGAICSSINLATQARIPTLLCDSSIAGAAVQSTSMHNHFGMGAVTADYICKRLKGKGNIATVNLPSNEAWDMRMHGLKFVLSRYPDIKVVANWDFSLTDSITPQQAVAGMLRGRDDIDAIWSAWDGGAVGAALSIRASGHDSIFVTGIDGGQQAFEYIKSGSPFCFTVAQSFYEEAYFNVYYAHEILAGRQAPRTIINPAYGVTRKMLLGGIPDDYDRPGAASKLGWQRVL